MGAPGPQFGYRWNRQKVKFSAKFDDIYIDRTRGETMVGSIGPMKNSIRKCEAGRPAEVAQKAAQPAKNPAPKSPAGSPHEAYTGRAVLNVAKEVALKAFTILNKENANFAQKEVEHIEKFARLVAGQAIREVKKQA